MTVPVPPANVRYCRRITTTITSSRLDLELRAHDVRCVAVGFVASFSALARLAPTLGPLCPFRRLTGIPCPMCGLTTASLRLLHGRPWQAVMTSPLIVVVLMAALWAFAPAWNSQRVLRANPRTTSVLTVLGSAWLYQLIVQPLH